MENAETIAGGWYNSFSDYLILSHYLRILPGFKLEYGAGATLSYIILSGYPILFNNSNGIMVNAETLAGG